MTLEVPCSYSPYKTQRVRWALELLKLGGSGSVMGLYLVHDWFADLSYKFSLN